VAVDLIVFLVCVSLVCLSVMMAHISYGCLSLKSINPIGFFVYTYLIYLLGACYIFWERHNIRSIRYEYLLMMVLGLVGVLIGGFMVCKVLSYRKIEVRVFVKDCDHVAVSTGKVVGLVLMVMFAAGLMLVWYSQFVSVIPGFYMFSIDATQADLREFRAASYKLLPGYVTHPMNLFRFCIVPYFVVLTFLLARRSAGVTLKIWFIVILLCGVIYNSYASALYPVAMLFVMLLLAGVIVSRRIRLSRSLILVGLLLAYPIGSDLIFSGAPFFETVSYSSTRHAARFFYDIPSILFSYCEYYFDINPVVIEVWQYANPSQTKRI